MFKNVAYAAAAAVALTAVPASAATVIYTSGSTIGLIAGPSGTFSGGFEASVVTGTGAEVGPDFTATFTFGSPTTGQAAGSAISIALGNMSNINFTGVTLNGVTGTVVNGPVDTAVVFGAPVAFGGTNQLVLTGQLNPPSGMGNGSFGGNVTIAAVPEPTTWALFILGFGTIGAALRRRGSQVRTAKAAIRFA